MADMESWQKQFFQFIEDTMQQVEQTLQQSEQFADRLADAIEEAVYEIDTAVETAIAPFVDLCLEADAAIEEAAQPLVQIIHPVMADHPACAGCQFYHGQTYGDSFLVCAMHPYGMTKEQPNCPDKEMIDWFPRQND
jgi:hypothetical protein